MLCRHHRNVRSSRRRSLSALVLMAATTSLLVFGFAEPTWAKSAREINEEANDAIATLKEDFPKAKKLLKKAKGILIFPEVIKAGMTVGGEYGEGVLRVGRKSVAYYATASASVGFQLGIQSKSVIIVFLESDALKKFQKSDGWDVGVDGSVALIDEGASAKLSSAIANKPIVAFVFGNSGLMASLTLEGTKITQIDR